MKSIHILITFLFFNISSFAQEVDDLKPVFKFLTETINYGKKNEIYSINVCYWNDITIMW